MRKCAKSHSRCEWCPWGEHKGSDNASRDVSIVEPIDKERDALDDPCVRSQGNQAQREWLAKGPCDNFYFRANLYLKLYEHLSNNREKNADARSRIKANSS